MTKPTSFRPDPEVGIVPFLVSIERSVSRSFLRELERDLKRLERTYSLLPWWKRTESLNVEDRLTLLNLESFLPEVRKCVARLCRECGPTVDANEGSSSDANRRGSEGDE